MNALKYDAVKLVLCAFCITIAASCALSVLSSDDSHAESDRVLIDGIYYVLNENEAAVVGPNNPAEYHGKIVIPETIEYNDPSTGIKKTYTITKIGMGAFYDNSFVLTVSLPDTINEIQNIAFQESGIGYVNMPAGLTSIGEQAFYGCTDLQCELIFPKSLANIGRFAFCNDNNLKNVTFMGENTKLGESVFDGDYTQILNGEYAKKGSFVLSDGVWVQTAGKCGDNLMWSYDENTLSITGSGAMYEFNGAPWDLYKSEINFIVMDDTVESISSNAFNGCTNLSTMNMPTDLKSIGDYAFSGCTNLQCNMEFPESLVSIGDCAFSGCNSIQDNLEFPKSVTIIGNNAFEGFTSLKKISMLYHVSVGADAFKGCTSFECIVIGKDVTFTRNPFPDYTFFSSDGKKIDITSTDFCGHEYKKNSSGQMTAIPQHIVSYDVDGGSEAAPDNLLIEENKTFKVADYSGTKAEYVFGGWKCDNKRTYQPGDIVTMGDKDIEFTAIWIYSPGPGPIPPEPIPDPPEEINHDVEFMAGILSVVFALCALAFVIGRFKK